MLFESCLVAKDKLVKVWVIWQDNIARILCLVKYFKLLRRPIVLPAESDSDVMFCLQSYQGLIIDRSLV